MILMFGSVNILSCFISCLWDVGLQIQYTAGAFSRLLQCRSPSRQKIAENTTYVNEIQICNSTEFFCIQKPIV